MTSGVLGVLGTTYFSAPAVNRQVVVKQEFNPWDEGEFDPGGRDPFDLGILSGGVNDSYYKQLASARSIVA